MKYIIILFAILPIFSRCGMDYNCTNEIINTINKTVNVEIQYDKDSVDSIRMRFGSTAESSSSYLNKQGSISGRKFKIDTISFSVIYHLNKNDTVTINKTIGGRLVEPDYSQIKKITLQMDSTIQIFRKDQLGSLFKKSENELLWIYKIQ